VTSACPADGKRFRSIINRRGRVVRACTACSGPPLQERCAERRWRQPLPQNLAKCGPKGRRVGLPDSAPAGGIQVHDALSECARALIIRRLRRRTNPERNGQVGSLCAAPAEREPKRLRTRAHHQRCGSPDLPERALPSATEPEVPVVFWAGMLD